MAALLDAATKLFAERGPAAVSLRDVAREANVNLGLIHRYIGGKYDLLSAVLGARAGMEPIDALPVVTQDDLVEVAVAFITADAALTRVLLRAEVEGFEVRRLQDSFPLLDRAANKLRTDLPRRDADVRVAFVAAAALGWQAIGPRLLEVLKQRDLSAEEVSDRLRPALHAFFSAEPSAEMHSPSSP